MAKRDEQPLPVFIQIIIAILIIIVVVPTLINTLYGNIITKWWGENWLWIYLIIFAIIIFSIILFVKVYIPIGKKSEIEHERKTEEDAVRIFKRARNKKERRNVRKEYNKKKNKID